jgi:hypothetical protein
MGFISSGSGSSKRVPDQLEAAVAEVYFVDGGEVGIAEFWPEDVMKVPAVGRKADDLPTGVVADGVTDIGGAQVLIILAIMGSRFLWERRGADRRFWSRAQWVVLIFVVAGIFGRLWFPDLNGVTQRVAYLGIYLWMLIIVREIELGKRSKAGETLVLREDEAGQTTTTI